MYLGIDAREIAPNRFYTKFFGLSTDTKPTTDLANGSIFIEIDTSKAYFFDEENKEWLQAASGEVDPQEIADVVAAYLDAHPEAVTTVQDGAITYAKLNSSLKESIDDVSDLKNAINILNDSAFDSVERLAATTANGWRLNESNGLCSANANYKLVKYTVTAGDVVKVVSDDRFQFQTIASVPSTGSSNRVGETYGVGTFVLIVPQTATYLIISTPTTSLAKVYSLIPLVEKVNSIDTLVKDNLYTEINKSLSELSWTDGAYIKTDGTIGQQSLYRYSSMMPVKAGSSVIYDLNNANNVACTICAYDATENFILSKSIYYDPTKGAGTVATFSGTYVVPDGVEYIRICHQTASTSQSVTVPVLTNKIDKIENDIEEIQEDIETLDLTNVWEGKKWVAFGTSITDNYSQNSYITQGDHAGEHTGKYVPYLLTMSKLSSDDFVNRGISGGSINGHILYYIRYYTSDEANADLITIEGAVNDFANSVPLGQVGDTVPYTHTLLPDGTSEGTFAGACYQAFTTALTNAPNAVVVLLTETTGKDHVGYANYNQLRKNSLNLTQWDYIDMTIKVARFVGIPVIMCGQNSMINAQNPQYIADHIHHTYLGGYQYARTIWEKLKRIPLKELTVPE